MHIIPVCIINLFLYTFLLLDRTQQHGESLDSILNSFEQYDATAARVDRPVVVALVDKLRHISARSRSQGIITHKQSNMCKQRAVVRWRLGPGSTENRSSNTRKAKAGTFCLVIFFQFWFWVLFSVEIFGFGSVSVLQTVRV